MKAVLPLEIRAVASMAAGADGLVWVVGMDGGLYRIRASKSERVALSHPKGVTRCSSVAVADGGVLVVFDGDDTKSHIGRVGASGALEIVRSDVEPRAVAASASSKGLWFTATDTTLREMTDHGSVAVEGHFNAIAVSPNGAHVLARRVPSDELVARDGAGGWRRVAERAIGSVAGVDDKGIAYVLELTPWDGETPSPSTLRAIPLDGSAARAVAEGPFVAAAVTGSGLIVAERTKSGFVIRSVTAD